MEKSEIDRSVTIQVDESSITVPAGISVAAAVLGHHHADETYTHPVDGSPRAPYCLMGVCFECMMEINGEQNVQSCLITVQEGMIIKRQVTTAEAE